MAPGRHSACKNLSLRAAVVWRRSNLLLVSRRLPSLDLSQDRRCARDDGARRVSTEMYTPTRCASRVADVTRCKARVACLGSALAQGARLCYTVARNQIIVAMEVRSNWAAPIGRVMRREHGRFIGRTDGEFAAVKAGG